MKEFSSLTLIDTHVFIGNWGFRRLRNNTTEAVIKMMDQFGTEKACVASADAILYRDCHQGNKKLREETTSYQERFLLYATINPSYPGWKRDLEQCIHWGFKAIRLYPNYHNYDIDDPEMEHLMVMAEKYGLPVSIPCRVEDRRQQHWLDRVEDIPFTSILEQAEKFPAVRIIVLESVLPYAKGEDIWGRIRNTGLVFELSRMTACLDKNLQVLTEELGAERVLLGTGFPFKTPSAAFLKLQALQLGEGDKSLIAGQNALHIFGVDD